MYHIILPGEVITIRKYFSLMTTAVYILSFLDRFALEVQGYCLMTNHIHLIATPHSEVSLSKAIDVTHLLYTRYINRMHKRDKIYTDWHILRQAAGQ